jgi:D-alanyl-D-alanine carboxypeptidase/D-alanyl-D-alanine-endopeptidase (penicillin-binding protein 4)
VRGRVAAVVAALLLAASPTPAAGAPGSASPAPASSAASPVPTTAPAASGLPAPPVLEPLAAGRPAASPRALSAAVAPTLQAAALGPDPGALVLSAERGSVLYGNGAAGPRTPASVAKLVTAALALAGGHSERRLATRVVRGTSVGELVLVGGGDPTLTEEADAAAYPAPAELSALADEVAATLTAEGAARVSIRVDDTAFAGPAVSPDWEDGYVPGDIVEPVSALSLAGEDDAEDPALRAGRRFAAVLRQRGVETAGRVRRAVAPGPATAPEATAPASPTPATWAAGAEIARVESPPVRVLVEQMLDTSDNDLAEALARHGAAAAGHPASFAGIAPAALDVLTRLGVPTDGVRMLDGSGLARGSTLAPATVAELLAVAASDEHPDLRPLITGLPVAGLTGTLAGRFTQPDTRGAAGVVRAKTGTLTGVTALAGTAYDADGRLLVFAVMADRVPATGTLDARLAQDRFAAALARCGCP